MAPNHNEFKNNDVILETKKLVEELLKSPEYAQKAIHDRNIIIKSLKADINHRKVVIREIMARYNDFSDENVELTEKVKNLSMILNETQQKLIKTTDQLSEVETNYKIEKKINEQIWFIKIEKMAEKLTGWRGFLIKVIFSRHTIQYISLAIFCLMFIASFTGWKFVADALTPIFKIFF